MTLVSFPSFYIEKAVAKLEWNEFAPVEQRFLDSHLDRTGRRLD